MYLTKEERRKFYLECAELCEQDKYYFFVCNEFARRSPTLSSPLEDDLPEYFLFMPEWISKLDTCSWFSYNEDKTYRDWKRDEQPHKVLALLFAAEICNDK